MVTVATPAGPRTDAPAPTAPGAGVLCDASWPAARCAAYHLARPLPHVRRPLAEAAGLVLSEPIRAQSPMPPRDASAMDGWAVSGPPPWRVVGELFAGDPPRDRLQDGTALVIATGAPVPAGAGAVLRREDGTVRSGLLHPLPGTPLPARRHIRPAGEEAHCGDVLLPAGTRLTPPALGLAAAAGYDDLDVHRPAAVRAFVLGDELLDTGRPRDGRVRDALGPQLPGWLDALGAAGAPPLWLPDRLDVLVDALAPPSHFCGPGTGADVLVTTGGSSLGRVDHVRSAVREVGGCLLIDGVAVRPGHPMALAWLPGGLWLVALPGNPLAACVALLTLAQPLLDRLHGLPAPRTSRARLAVDIPGSGHGHRLLPARRTGDTATPLPHNGSGMLRGLALADTVLAVPPGGALAGATIAALALPWCTPPSDAHAAEHHDEGFIS